MLHGHGPLQPPARPPPGGRGQGGDGGAGGGAGVAVGGGEEGGDAGFAGHEVRPGPLDIGQGKESVGEGSVCSTATAG